MSVVMVIVVILSVMAPNIRPGYKIFLDISLLYEYPISQAAA
jgi:hypothetical protein